MIGTIIVQEAHAAEEVKEEVTQLTINSLEIYENADYTRYRVTGDAPASTDITFKTTKPDGSPGNYPGGVDTGKPAYIVDNKIDSANNLVYGTWTLEVCAPEYDMCVEDSFTIDEPVTLPDDEVTQTEKVVAEEKSTEEGGGCLIATATYGSEMAIEVQQLRELRDNTLLNTESGTAFMGMFNDIYYSFSPTIADMEREHPMFKEAVKLAITPMISSLSLMENANSESEVLGIGISVIMLNLGMYLGVPAVVVVGIRKRILKISNNFIKIRCKKVNRTYLLAIIFGLNLDTFLLHYNYNKCNYYNRNYNLNCIKIIHIFCCICCESKI